MSQPDTKQKLLDCAEELFAQDGFHAVSLRAITHQAGANLAAVNYHFGSKEALLEAVITRRLEPLNVRRLELLEQELAGAAREDRRPRARAIWRALAEPTLQLREPGSGAEHFVALVGRLLSEFRGPAREIFLAQMGPLMMRIFLALQQALPGLPADQLFWRVHFAIGALAHIMRCDVGKMPLPPGVDPELETGALVEALLDFTVAGLEEGV